MQRAERDIADGLFENHARHCLPGLAFSQRREQPRRSNGRVSGKRKLRARSKYTYATRRRTSHSREHEHGLRKIELRGNCLHAIRFERLCAKHHGKRVATEQGVGKHVQRVETQINYQGLNLDHSY